jgi:hypothetical protein
MERLALLLLFAGATAHADTTGADADVRLARAWRTLHPGATEPAICQHPDPVREFSGDVDSTPGIETALGSLRFGVVLFSATGTALAHYELGCGEKAYTKEERAHAAQLIDFTSVRASGLAPNDLVVRRRVIARCGRFDFWEPLARKGTTLNALASIEESVDRACGISPKMTYEARIQVREVGTFLVEHVGTISTYREGGHWTPRAYYHDHAFFRLVDGVFKAD